MTETDATPPARRRGAIAALVVVALALAVGGGFWLRSLLLAPQSDADGTPATLRLEAATRAGEDPFTASVVAPEHDVDAVFSDTIVARTVEITQQAATDSTTGAAQVPAAAPGLYGGSGELSACDPSALVDYLVADGAKAAAWSGVIGIAAESIPEYVAGLTAVVLTVDTLVTNHGFAAGAATAHQSLLQAGTAILVDARGLPVVRCACGNPLLPPRFSGSAIGADTIGTAWDGLDLQRVVTVTPAPADLSGFTVADLATGDLVEIPVGGTTAVDGVYLATSSNHAQVSLEPEPLAGSIQTSPDGVDWTVALETTPMLDVATGGGLAVAVGMSAEDGGAIHTSADGSTWSEAIEVIDPLRAVAYGDGVWVAVGDRSFAEEGGAGDASSGAIYRSDDGAAWQRVATTDPYENAELAGSGEFLYQGMTSVGYGDGRWIATATECAYRICMRVLFTSTDTRTWTRMALDERIVLIDVAHNGQEWGFVGGEPLPDPRDNSEIGVPIGAAGTSPDGTTWSLGATSPDRVVLTGLNPGDGEWLAVDAYVPRTPDDPPAAGGIYRSTDILTWERIGTAAPWTTSVALLRLGAAPTPTAEDTPDTEVATVRIRTDGLELLSPDGTTLQLLPYSDPATGAIEAVTEALGSGNSEPVAGDNICSADSTVLTWGGLRLVHPEGDPGATGWWVWLDGDPVPSATVTVDGPGGVTSGQSVAEVRSAHPEAPIESFSYEGVDYDLVYLDVTGRTVDGTTSDMAVEASAENGVIVRMHAPVYVVGDC